MPRKSPFMKIIMALLAVAGTLPLVYFASVQIGLAQAAAGDSIDPAAMDAGFDRYVENVAFGEGEKLDFKVNYGYINAGTASLEVAQLIDYNNRPCYQIDSRARSNSFFDAIYKVDDHIESVTDAIGIFSWYFRKNLKEGSYRSDRSYEFDQRRNEVFYNDDTIDVPPFCQDALSVLYWTRTQDLEVGKTIYCDNFVDGHLTALEINVLAKETITVEAGTFECFVVQPLLENAGVFKHEGKLTVWLTADRVKMPVLMKSKVLVGHISAELTDYKLGNIETF